MKLSYPHYRQAWPSVTSGDLSIDQRVRSVHLDIDDDEIEEFVAEVEDYLTSNPVLDESIEQLKLSLVERMPGNPKAIRNILLLVTWVTWLAPQVVIQNLAPDDVAEEVRLQMATYGQAIPTYLCVYIWSYFKRFI